MAALFSQMFPIPGISGGAAGGSHYGGGPATSGSATNNSINVNGASGGALRDLMQLIHVSSGPPANGGFTGSFTADTPYGSVITRSEQQGTAPMPLILFALAGLAVILLIRK